MVSENKDDDVAVELHSKVYEPLTYYGDLGLSSLPVDLFTLQVLYFFSNFLVVIVFYTQMRISSWLLGFWSVISLLLKLPNGFLVNII